MMEISAVCGGRDYRRNINSSANVTVRNNIAYQPQGLNDMELSSGSNSDYNLVGDGIFPSVEGSNSIAGNPMFANPPRDGRDLGVRTWVNGVEYLGNDLMTYQQLRSQIATRFALQAGSPCIDGGTTVSGVTNGYTGSAPDMGPFER